MIDGRIHARVEDSQSKLNARPRVSSPMISLKLPVLALSVARPVTWGGQTGEAWGRSEGEYLRRIT
jgi:hypothetical protein